MALELKQQIKLSQQLVMTPQLQQAIKLLQLSRQELLEAVEQELVENPMLDVDESGDELGAGSDESDPEAQRAGEGDEDSEASAEAQATERPERQDGTGDGAEEQSELAAASSESQGASEAPTDADPRSEAEPSAEDMVGDVDWENYMESRPHTSLARADDDRPRIEDNTSPGTSLSDHLLWQLGFLALDAREEEIAVQIIGNLNENGYLEEEIGEIAETLGGDVELAQKVLSRVQEFDPIGVAARSLAECLLVQAHHARIENPLVLQIIEEHLDLLQRKDFRGIARIRGVTVEDVAAAADVIASFEPRPGRAFASEDPIYITPDIFVHKIGDEYHVVLNEDGLPRLRVSSAYREVLHRSSGEAKETKDYVREKLRSAVWMIKSIHQRQRTIVKVMQSILRFQREFFDRGTEFLRPLNLRDVAEDIGMHESTVSRVTTNKYVQTPHGVFELKYFFNSSIQTGDGDSIASESVKEKIRAIIANEDASKPLSDQRIAEILHASKIHIARRTVTKYRESMRILSSTRRRQFR